LLVPLVEEGWIESPVTAEVLRIYMAELMEQARGAGLDADTLVLGCTHYPLLKGAIAKVVGPRVRLIDSAEQCAQDVARRLLRKGLLRGSVGSPDETTADGLPAATMGTLRSFVTDDPARFAALASRFLEMELERPELVNLGEAQDAAPPALRAAG
jgi:glutamate racemase